jgi:hypothetical protein
VTGEFFNMKSCPATAAFPLPSTSWATVFPRVKARRLLKTRIGGVSRGAEASTATAPPSPSVAAPPSPFAPATSKELPDESPAAVAAAGSSATLLVWAAVVTGTSISAPTSLKP